MHTCLNTFIKHRNQENSNSIKYQMHILMNKCDILEGIQVCATACSRTQPDTITFNMHGTLAEQLQAWPIVG